MPTLPAEIAIEGDLAAARPKFRAELDPPPLLGCDDRPELGSRRADKTNNGRLPAATNRLEAFDGKTHCRPCSAADEAGHPENGRKNGLQPNKLAISRDAVAGLPVGLD